VIREARPEDLPAIRRLMEAEPGFWQRDWSDATLARGLETAGDLALVWEDDSTIAGFVCAHDLGFRAYLSELIVARGARGRGIRPESRRANTGQTCTARPPCLDRRRLA
jgi:ribosomal protein S18 acetylase RimI-like enzyme